MDSLFNSNSDSSDPLFAWSGIGSNSKPTGTVSQDILNATSAGKAVSLNDYNSLLSVAGHYGQGEEAAQVAEEATGDTGFLHGLFKVANYIPGTLAGTTEWIGLKSQGQDVSWSSRQQKYTNNIWGFSDYLRRNAEVTGAPGFVLGFGLDVFLDPTTYLTFGASALGKGALKGSMAASKFSLEVPTKLYDDVAKTWVVTNVKKNFPVRPEAFELVDSAVKGGAMSMTDQLVKEGMDITEATALAKKTAQTDVDRMVNEAIKDGDVSQKTFDDLYTKGFDRSTLEEIAAIGPRLIDRGGINWFGKRLVDSEVLRQVPVIKQLVDFYNSAGVQELRDAIKVPFARAFTYGFAKHPEVLRLLEMAAANKQTLAADYGADVSKAISGLNDAQLSDLLEGSFGLKNEIVAEAQKRSDALWAKVTEANPELSQRLQSMSGLGIRMDEIENFANETIKSRQKIVDDKVATYQAEIDRLTREEIKAGGLSMESENLQKLINNQRELSKLLKERKKELAEQLDLDLSARTPTMAEAGTRELARTSFSEEEQRAAFLYGINHMEKSAFDNIEKLTAKLDKFDDATQKFLDGEMTLEELEKELGIKFIGKAEKVSTKVSTQPNFVIGALAPATRGQLTAKVLDELNAYHKEIAKEIASLSKTYESITQTIPEISNARRAVKAEFKKAGIKDFGDENVNKAAHALWNDKDGIVTRMSRDLGINEADIFHMYIPEMYKPERALSAISHGSRVWWSRQLDKTKDNILDLATFKARGGITDTKEILRNHVRKVAQEVTSMTMFRTAQENLGKPLEQFLEEGEVLSPFTKKLADARAKEDGYVWLEKKLPDNQTLGSYFPQYMSEQVRTGLTDPDLFKITDNGIYKTVAWANSLFKSASTSLFPSFHMKNMTGNAVNTLIGLGPMSTIGSYLDDTAGRMAGYHRGSSELANINLKPLQAWIKRGVDGREVMEKKFITNVRGESLSEWQLLKKIRREYPELFSSSQLGIDELGLNEKSLPYLIEKIAGQSQYGGLQGTKLGNTLHHVLDPNSKFWSTARAIGAETEASAKLRNIVAVWKDGGTIRDGIEMAETNLFNYSKLTGFERVYLKQFIPFYTFFKKNLEFQVKQLATKPAGSFIQLKALNSLSSSFGQSHDPDENGLPSYLGNTMGFHLGNRYISGLGLPIEDSMRLLVSAATLSPTMAIKDVLRRTSPIFKAPIELSTGHDLFRDKPIIEIQNPDDFSSLMSNMPDPIGKSFRHFIGYTEYQKPIIKDGEIIGHKVVAAADPWKLWFLRNLASSRIQTTLGKIDKSFVDSNENKLSDFAQVISGVASTDVDPKIVQLQQDFAKEEALGKWMAKIGMIEDYHAFYIPKEPSTRLR